MRGSLKVKESGIRAHILDSHTKIDIGIINEPEETV